MLALWQILALVVLVPMALFFGARALSFVVFRALVVAQQKQRPSKAWIKQQQQAYRSYNKPTVKPPPVIVPRPYPRKSAYYQEFLKKRDYS